MEEEDKIIANALNIPLQEYKSKTVLYSSEYGKEIIFGNKSHSIQGDIFYLVEVDDRVKIKRIVFVESILNMILLLKSKKIIISPNLVFVVSNNPESSLHEILNSKFKIIISYTFAFAKTIQGKIQLIKTLLFALGCNTVRIFSSENKISVFYDNNEKHVNSNTSLYLLIRYFNFKKSVFHVVSLGYNVYNLKHLYEYKD